MRLITGCLHRYTPVMASTTARSKSRVRRPKAVPVRSTTTIRAWSSSRRAPLRPSTTLLGASTKSTARIARTSGILSTRFRLCSRTWPEVEVNRVRKAYFMNDMHPIWTTYGVKAEDGWDVLAADGLCCAPTSRTRPASWFAVANSAPTSPRDVRSSLLVLPAHRISRYSVTFPAPLIPL
jgi:hypothetical protein